VVLSRVDDLAELGEISAEPGTQGGRGGMGSKVAAAGVARLGGCQAVIANGHDERVVPRVEAGDDIGTWLPAGAGLSSRRRWIAFGTAPRGTLHLDQGAVDALCLRNASLLPVGVLRVEGNFQRSDVVVMIGPAGETVGRGLALYDSETMRRLCGARLFNDQLSAEQKGPNALLRRTHVVLETNMAGGKSAAQNGDAQQNGDAKTTTQPESSPSSESGTPQEIR
jgi:glutamate 5-kinase